MVGESLTMMSNMVEEAFERIRSFQLSTTYLYGKDERVCCLCMLNIYKLGDLWSADCLDIRFILLNLYVEPS